MTATPAVAAKAIPTMAATDGPPRLLASVLASGRTEPAESDVGLIRGPVPGVEESPRVVNEALALVNCDAAVPGTPCLTTIVSMAPDGFSKDDTVLGMRRFRVNDATIIDAT